MPYLCHPNALKKVYFAYIHSYNMLWYFGATSKYSLNKVLIIQKRAIQIMVHLKFNESAKLHFNNLNILTVHGKYIFEIICLARDENIKKDRFKTHNYNTRHK